MSGHVLFGVTGGIAAFKAVSVVRLLKKSGLDVRVAPTANALRMVGAATWEAVSGHRVFTDPFEAAGSVEHVSLGAGADAALVAPATANFLGKMAGGLADDMLSSAILACTGPVMLAPAMHTQMWENAAVRANVRTLQQRGVHFVGPVSGALTSGDSGIGRLAEPEDIAQSFMGMLNRGADSGPLAGRHVLVCAGGTREPIDPVRFLGNRSSGIQGALIAQRALELGARVTVVDANMSAEVPAGVQRVGASSAQQMFDAVQSLFISADVLVMAAAVADFRPAQVQDSKIKKADGGLRSIELVENPDILRWAGEHSRAGQIVVGFAAETAEGDLGLSYAKSKMKKGCDLLVYNVVGFKAGFGETDSNAVILGDGGRELASVNGSKRQVAVALLDEVVSALSAER